MSSSVQYYEKQMELQNTITNCEQQRMDLERQIQMALKADQTSAKMKASKLHTYWRKICEDERRAKQRNEMLIRDFERIDAHMSELNVRTQRLALIKKQYEDYILSTYPKWNELILGFSNQPQRTPSVNLQHSQQMQEKVGNLSSRSHSVAETHGGLKNNVDGRSDTSKVYCQQPQKEQQRQQQVQDQWQKQQGTQEKMLYTQQVVSKQTGYGIYANLPNSHPDSQKLHRTEASDHAQVSQHTQEGIVSQSNKSTDIQVTNSPAKLIKAGNTMQPEEGEDEEDISDFGSDNEIPMGQSLGNTQIRVNTQPAPGKLSSSSKINGSTNPELSIDGLINLLQLVESDIVDAFSCEDYYRRSTLPNTADKNDVIRKANSDGVLSKMDISMITMVILGEITNIVYSLPEKYLLPESLLQNVSGLDVALLRQHLSPEAQAIWDALYVHFIKLVRSDVMKPQELSTIFAPCLVATKSSLNKAQKFIVQLLEGMVNSTNEISTIPNANMTSSPGQTMERSRSLIDDDKVPPLKFGSLLDRPLSDDDSSYINSSLPRDQIPLNETEAYKSMVSVSSNRHPHRQLSVQDDTDDDVEKQITSALGRNTVTQKPAEKKILEVDDPSETTSQTLQTSPHVYVPSAIEPRHTAVPPRKGPMKFQGLKISSDLDTDTEVDPGIFGSSRPPEDNSDFDFYD